MSGNIIKKTFNTLKSDGPNKALLDRLKKISVHGEKTISENVKVEDDDSSKPDRNLPVERLGRLLQFHWTDPLIWNHSTLSRIFRVPDDYCWLLCRYVRPMLHFADSHMDEPVKLFKTPIVIDVERLKHDKNYMEVYQKFAFFEGPKPKPPLISDERVSSNIDPTQPAKRRSSAGDQWVIK